jgi:hypothetical protein
MEKIVITEEQVKKVLENILTEDMSRVSRQDFSRIQFKIEELENSLDQTINEYRKLQNSVPAGLKTVTNTRILSIASYLGGIQRDILKLKEGVKTYKRRFYNQQPIEMQEKKK